MRTKRRQVALMFILLVPILGLAWLVAIAYGWFEPVYDGHHISYWIALKTHSAGGGASSYYIRETMGTNGQLLPKVDSRAVPYLVRALQLKESRWRRWYYDRYIRVSPRWQKFLFPPLIPEIARLNASWMLGDTGPAAPKTISALAACATNENGAIAMQVLISIGVSTPESIHTVSEIVSKDTNRLNRSIAIGAFTRLERDPNPAVREAAAKALDGMGAEHPLKAN